jgi:hypothetical protein
MNGMSSLSMRRSSARFSFVSSADSTIHHRPRIFTKLRPISRAAKFFGRIGSATHKRPSPEFGDLPFGYVVAISFEEQPAGVCLHVSVSAPWSKVAPNMVVCAMIFNALDFPAEADHVWTEEFLIDGKPGGRAFNVVWLVGRGIDKSEEITPGHRRSRLVRQV